MYKNSFRLGKRVLISLASVLLLIGCAQQHAFISANGVKPSKINALSQQLEAQGWQVTLTQLEIPAEFSDTSIAMNPAQQNQDAIEQLITLLQQLGFNQPQTYKFAEGKHFYSIDNIGLYIRGSQSTATPPNWLRSDNCTGGDTLLALNPGGNVTLEHEVLDTELEQLDSYQGQWQFDGETLVIHIMDHQQHYLRTEITRQTWRGDSPAQLFTPLKEVEFAPLNCSFIIIEME